MQTQRVATDAQLVLASLAAAWNGDSPLRHCQRWCLSGPRTNRSLDDDVWCETHFVRLDGQATGLAGVNPTQLW